MSEVQTPKANLNQDQDQRNGQQDQQDTLVKEYSLMQSIDQTSMSNHPMQAQPLDNRPKSKNQKQLTLNTKNEPSSPSQPTILQTVRIKPLSKQSIGTIPISAPTQNSPRPLESDKQKSSSVEKSLIIICSNDQTDGSNSNLNEFAQPLNSGRNQGYMMVQDQQRIKSNFAPGAVKQQTGQHTARDTRSSKEQIQHQSYHQTENLTERSHVIDVVQQKLYVHQRKVVESAPNDSNNNGGGTNRSIEKISIQGQHLIPMKGVKDIQKYMMERDKKGKEADSPSGNESGNKQSRTNGRISPRAFDNLLPTRKTSRLSRKNSKSNENEGLTNKSIISYQLYQNFLESKDKFDLKEINFEEFSSIRGFDTASVQDLIDQKEQWRNLNVVDMAPHPLQQVPPQNQSAKSTPKSLDTSLRCFQQKKSSNAFEKKNKMQNNVFGGLKAAQPNINLQRALHAEQRNISPHAHHKAQINPVLRQQMQTNQQNQLSFGQFVKFENVKRSTIQHQSSIQVDPQHAQETMKVLNVDVDNFLYSEHESTKFFNRKKKGGISPVLIQNQNRKTPESSLKEPSIKMMKSVDNAAVPSTCVTSPQNNTTDTQVSFEKTTSKKEVTTLQFAPMSTVSGKPTLVVHAESPTNKHQTVIEVTKPTSPSKTPVKLEKNNMSEPSQSNPSHPNSPMMMKTSFACLPVGQKSEFSSMPEFQLQSQHHQTEGGQTRDNQVTSSQINESGMAPSPDLPTTPPLEARIVSPVAQMLPMGSIDNIVLNTLDKTNLLLKEKHDQKELQFLRDLSIHQQKVARQQIDVQKKRIGQNIGGNGYPRSGQFSEAYDLSQISESQKAQYQAQMSYLQRNRQLVQGSQRNGSREFQTFGTRNAEHQAPTQQSPKNFAVFGLPKQFNTIGTKHMKKLVPNDNQLYVQTIVCKKTDNVEELHDSQLVEFTIDNNNATRNSIQNITEYQSNSPHHMMLNRNLDIANIKEQFSPMSQRLEGQSPLDQIIASNEVNLQAQNSKKMKEQMNIKQTTPLNVYTKVSRESNRQNLNNQAPFNKQDSIHAYEENVSHGGDQETQKTDTKGNGVTQQGSMIDMPSVMSNTQSNNGQRPGRDPTQNITNMFKGQTVQCSPITTHKSVRSSDMYSSDAQMGPNHPVGRAGAFQNLQSIGKNLATPKYTYTNPKSVIKGLKQDVAIQNRSKQQDIHVSVVKPKVYFASLPGDNKNLAESLKFNKNAQKKLLLNYSPELYNQIAKGGLRAKQALEHQQNLQKDINCPSVLEDSNQGNSEQDLDPKFNLHDLQKHLIIPKLKLSGTHNVDHSSEYMNESVLSNALGTQSSPNDGQRIDDMEGGQDRRGTLKKDKHPTMTGTGMSQYSKTDKKRDSRFSFVDNKRSITTGYSDRPDLNNLNKDLPIATSTGNKQVKRDKSPKSPQKSEQVNIIFNKTTGDWLQMSCVPTDAAHQQSTSEKTYIDQFPKYMSCVPKDDKTIKQYNKSPPQGKTELNLLRQIQFPTKRNPVLPQSEKGFIRFTDDLPPPSYSLGFTQAEPQSNFHQTHREKIKLVKNEKLKQQNLNEQHQWKLNTKHDPVSYQFNIKLEHQRKQLVHKFIREDLDRRKEFGELDDDYNQGMVPGYAFRGNRGSLSVKMNQENLMAQNFQQKQSNAFKQRLINGIQSVHPSTDGQLNKSQKVQVQGYKTTMPGFRFRNIGDMTLGSVDGLADQDSTMLSRGSSKEQMFSYDRTKTPKNIALASLLEKRLLPNAAQQLQEQKQKQLKKQLLNNTLSVNPAPLISVSGQKAPSVLMPIAARVNRGHKSIPRNRQKFPSNQFDEMPTAELITNVDVFRKQNYAVSKLQGIREQNHALTILSQKTSNMTNKDYKITDTQAEIMANYSQF